MRQKRKYHPKPGVQSFLLEFGGVLTRTAVIEYLRAGDDWKHLWRECMAELRPVADVEEMYLEGHLWDRLE